MDGKATSGPYGQQVAEWTMHRYHGVGGGSSVV